MAGPFRKSRIRRFWFYAALMAAVCLAPGYPRVWGASGNPIVAEVVVEIKDVAGPSEKMKRLARSLIDIQEGKPFSADHLFRSIEALKRSGLYSEISVPDPDWETPPLRLLFRLTPFPRIREIHIKGGFPLLEREIRNVMTITVGDAFRPGSLPEQEEYVRELFANEGYIRPEVDAGWEEVPGKNHVAVKIEIEEGPFYHLEKVRLAGNDSFSDLRLKMRLNTYLSSKLWGGPSRFVPEDLTEDIKTLRQFYRGKGYCEVELSEKVEKDERTGRVVLSIEVKEGPRYKVDFAGNEVFWGFTLDNELVIFTEGNENGFGLSKSLRNIRERYRQAGYLDAKVSSTEEEKKAWKQGVRAITIVIDEGPRYIVEEVEISGNRHFDDDKIQKQMIIAPPGLLHDGQYVPEALEKDMRAIESLYLEEGFRKARAARKVEEKAPAGSGGTVQVTVMVTIEEGPRTTVEAVAVEGLSAMMGGEARKALTMKAGDPFRAFLIESERARLAARVSEQGYPHVTVTPQVDIASGQTKAEITYRVEPGLQIFMGETLFIGNFKTRRRVLAREMTLKPGEPFSLAEMLVSQSNIRSLNAVDSARFEIFGLAEKAAEVDMLSEIQEIRPYFVEIAAGYDTRRQAYLNLAGGSSNLLGLNKELRLATELSQIGYEAQLGLFEPRFFGTRIKSSINLYAEEIEEPNQNFGVRAYGASLGLAREMTEHLDANLNFQFEYREQYRTDGMPVPADERGDYDPRSILVATPALVYNSTDSFVRPSSGGRATFSVDISKGLENSLDDFFKYRLDGRYYYTPFERFTLAARGRIGYIEPYGGMGRVPEDQLFFLGGIADVRGFAENRLRFDEEEDPVGGRTAYLGSLEGRIDIGWNFELALFYDTGAVKDALVDAGTGDFRSSAGLALRYITPIGPIGGMYGWKLDQKEGESPGAFHFAIGYTF
jgi:outer membrane protein insertion porin family